MSDPSEFSKFLPLAGDAVPKKRKSRRMFRKGHCPKCGHKIPRSIAAEAMGSSPTGRDLDKDVARKMNLHSRLGRGQTYMARHAKRFVDCVRKEERERILVKLNKWEQTTRETRRELWENYPDYAKLKNIPKPEDPIVPTGGEGKN